MLHDEDIVIFEDSDAQMHLHCTVCYIYWAETAARIHTLACPPSALLLLPMSASMPASHGV